MAMPRKETEFSIGGENIALSATEIKTLGKLITALKQTLKMREAQLLVQKKMYETQIKGMKLQKQDEENYKRRIAALQHVLKLMDLITKKQAIEEKIEKAAAKETGDKKDGKDDKPTRVSILRDLLMFALIKAIAKATTTSAIVNTTLGTLSRMLGVLVDLVLLPFLPLIVTVLVMFINAILWAANQWNTFFGPDSPFGEGGFLNWFKIDWAAIALLILLGLIAGLLLWAGVPLLWAIVAAVLVTALVAAVVLWILNNIQKALDANNFLAVMGYVWALIMGIVIAALVVALLIAAGVSVGWAVVAAIIIGAIAAALIAYAVKQLEPLLKETQDLIAGFFDWESWLKDPMKGLRDLMNTFFRWAWLLNPFKIPMEWFMNFFGWEWVGADPFDKVKNLFLQFFVSVYNLVSGVINSVLSMLRSIPGVGGLVPGNVPTISPAMEKSLMSRTNTAPAQSYIASLPKPFVSTPGAATTPSTTTNQAGNLTLNFNGYQDDQFIQKVRDVLRADGTRYRL